MMEDRIGVPTMTTVLILSIILPFGYIMFFDGPFWVIIIPAAMMVCMVSLDTLIWVLRRSEIGTSAAH